MAVGRIPDIRKHLPSTAFALLFLFLIAAFLGIFIYLGLYNIGADAPHSKLVYNALDQLRDRSIARNSRVIVPPADLSSSKRIAAGAGLYGEMCTGCHLGPGMAPTELSQGLYPQAPIFPRDLKHTPAEQFWIIKHGVKLTAMPAWGKTHDNELVWDLVAFLQKLPTMSPDQYRPVTANAPEEHEEMMKAPHAHSHRGEQHASGT